MYVILKYTLLINYYQTIIDKRYKNDIYFIYKLVKNTIKITLNGGLNFFEWL